MVMRFGKMSVFLVMLCLFSTLSAGVVAADTSPSTNGSQLKIVNDSEYDQEINDKKFDLKLAKANDHTYQITVSRKDNDFTNFITWIHVKIMYVDIAENVRFLDQLINLNGGQRSTSKVFNVDTLKDSPVTISDYGIQFPASTSHLSFDDNVFNLELQYWDPFIGAPYIKYWFYRKDGRPMDCHVTLKRSVSLKFRNCTWVDDAGVGLEPGESRKEGTLHYEYLEDGSTTLLGFTTTPKDYYFQFS